MSLSDPPERRFPISEAAGYAVLVAIAAGFLALHILAGHLMPPSPGSASTAASSARMWED
jgi:hypothetical protein